MIAAEQAASRPHGYDVSDAIRAGLTRDDLLRLAAEAPEWTPPNAPPQPEAPTPTPLRRAIITAGDLAGKVFPDPRYAVPKLVPEGSSLLVGAPKKGKSWLLLDLGIAIAAGGRALGKIAVDAGDVLLLCLEDNQRRLQERLWRVLDGEPPPDRLHLATEWSRLDQGGAAELDAWLSDHPDARLVGIDVLARLRPPTTGNGSQYQDDYALMAAFKAVADRHRVALVAVHHTRKAAADDPLDAISGTTGLAGAADTALILTREKGRADANLYVRGRDVPEADFALSFDPVDCRWTLLGDAEEFRLTAGRAEVVRLLRTCGPATPKEIAAALKQEPGNVRVLLHRMKNAGQLWEREGRYQAPDLLHPVTPPPVTPRDGDSVPSEGTNEPSVTPVTPLHRESDREVIDL